MKQVETAMEKLNKAITRVMSEDIYQNLKYHGQKIVSSVLNQDNLIQSLSNNLIL